MKKTLLLLAFLIANITAFAQIKLTDENAEKKLLVENNRLIVLEFYADWCSYCKKMKPIMLDIVSAYGDKVDFYKINVDENEVDDALEVTSLPSYFFIKNGKTIEVIEGAMSKESMVASIELLYHSDELMELLEESEEYSVWTLHDESGELSKEKNQHIWNDSNKLNLLAWHVYMEHNDQNDINRAIELVKRSIQLDTNAANLDTHAALLYKTKNYKEALKKAVEAIRLAIADDMDYSTTLNLIEKIAEDME